MFDLFAIMNFCVTVNFYLSLASEESGAGSMRFFVENTEQEIKIDTENSLLEHLIQNDIEIAHSCGGMGSCGTCRILITEGLEHLPRRNPEEQERAQDLSFKDFERLSCQICPIPGMKIRIP